MYCKKCGNEIKEGAKFCTKCGNVVINETAPEVKEEKTINLENISEPEVISVPAKKKGNPVLIILIVIFSLIIVGLLVFIGSYLIGNKNSGINEPEIKDIDPSTDYDVDDYDDEDDDITDIDTSDTVSLKGYTFTIPTGWTYDDKKIPGFIGLKDDDNTVIGYFVPMNGEFDTSEAVINSYKQSLTKNGYTIKKCFKFKH